MKAVNITVLEPKVRLLVVSPSVSGGGAERFASTFLCHVDRQRFDVSLCLMRDQVSYPVPEDVPVTIIEKWKPWHIPRAIFRLRLAIRQQQPDVVLSVMESVAWLVEAARSGVRAPCSHVARFAISPAAPLPILDRLVLPAVKPLYRRADILVSNSSACARQIETWLGGTGERVRSIPNPIDHAHLERLASDEPPESNDPKLPTLIFVGRLDIQKRPDIMLDAFVKVCRQREARLIYCGDGPLRESLMAQVTKLDLSENVNFLGFQPNPYQWMAQADLFVLTSDFEGLPNALIEAQALGLPAVSTNCPTGPNEIIENGVTGLLVPTGDADAVSKAILALLDNPQRRNAMGGAARLRAERLFHLEIVMKQWEELLSDDASVNRSSNSSGAAIK